MLACATLQRKRRQRSVSRRSRPVYGSRVGNALDGRSVLDLLLIAYGLIFNTVQANSVAHALRFAFNCPEWLTGGALALLTLLTIVTGLKGVARLMQWLVPLMALLWVSTSVMVCAIHIDEVPNVIVTIFQSAFGWREAASGALGYTLSRSHCGFSARHVLQRSGNGLHAECRRSGRIPPPHPAAQGIVQMIGVFTDTIVICSASAMIMLLAGAAEQPSGSTAGIHWVQQALVSLVGGWGAGLVALVVGLFAFSSIAVNYIYAENNLIFLKVNSRLTRNVLRAGVLGMVFVGSLLSMPLVWQIADVIMALMAITNLTAILLLSPVVALIARDYLRQRKLGVQPVFDASRYPEIESQIAPALDDLPRQ